MGDTTLKTRDKWWQGDLGRSLALVVSMLLGGGYLGVKKAEEVDNDTSMLQQHTEVLRERMNNLEEVFMKHQRNHMEEAERR